MHWIGLSSVTGSTLALPTEEVLGLGVEVRPVSTPLLAPHHRLLLDSSPLQLSGVFGHIVDLPLVQFFLHLHCFQTHFEFPFLRELSFSF